MTSEKVNFCINFKILWIFFIVPVSVKGKKCDSYEETTFIKTENLKLPSTPRATFLSLPMHECRTVCIQDAFCGAFTLNKMNKKCQIYTIAPDSGYQLSPDKEVDHYQKICLPTKDPICSTSFTRIPQMTLIGFSEVVIQPSSLENCLLECLNHDSCRSTIYFYDEEQCVLNAESKNGQENQFHTFRKEEFKVDYFEPQCFATWISEWSSWTSCSSEGSQQRLRVCSQPGKCRGPGLQVKPCSSVFSESPTPSPSLEDLVPKRRFRTTSGCFWGFTPCSTPKPIISRAETATESSLVTYLGRRAQNRCLEFKKLGYNTYGECLRLIEILQ